MTVLVKASETTVSARRTLSNARRASFNPRRDSLVPLFEASRALEARVAHDPIKRETKSTQLSLTSTDEPIS